MLLRLAFIIFITIPAINQDTSSKIVSPYKSVAVVQLFTSQGCSSCPSADKLLEEIKTKYSGQVIVLSYHVDYWNRLGWKDPFSSRDYSLLQEAYGFKFNSRSVYTPQAIINGSVNFVGSNRQKMDQYVTKYLRKVPSNEVTISEAIKNKKRIEFEYTVQGDLIDKSLKASLVIDRRETEVTRGENNGYTLINSNIVVSEIDLEPIAKGKASILIPEIVKDDDSLNLILYVQNKGFTISGASEMEVQSTIPR